MTAQSTMRRSAERQRSALTVGRIGTERGRGFRSDAVLPGSRQVI
jgi:hypothetical protein